MTEPDPQHRYAARLRKAMPVSAIATLAVLIAVGLVDLPRVHQAAGLTDDHNHAGGKLSRACDAACGRRRVSAADLPGGPIEDHP